MSDQRVKVLKKEGFLLFITVISAVIYTIGFVWFLEPVGVYAGGVTGIAQLINQAFKMIDIPVNIGLLVFLLNIPIFLLGYKHISKRFAIYSAVSVIVQAILTSGVIPFVDFVINYGENTDYLVCTIMGAILTGAGCGLALRYGSSTGGIDILAQIASLKDSKISVGNLSMIINVLIACVGGGLIQGNLAIIIYTLIRIILSSLVIDKIHTAYNYMMITIISNKREELTDVILRETHRGCTIIDGEGAYTHTVKHEIIMVVSKYEIHTTIDLIKKIDPYVFIAVSPVKRIFGNYKKKPIA